MRQLCQLQAGGHSSHRTNPRPITNSSHGGGSTSGRCVHNPSVRRVERFMTVHVASIDAPAEGFVDEAEPGTTDDDSASAAAEAQAQLAKEREREVTAEQLQREVARRRNFAIISHPDAGKTTLVGPQHRLCMGLVGMRQGAWGHGEMLTACFHAAMLTPRSSFKCEP